MNLRQMKTDIDISVRLILMLMPSFILTYGYDMSAPFSLDISSVMLPLMLMLMSLAKTRLNRVAWNFRRI